MAKKPKVPCWQCGKVFKGEAACVAHAQDKGHQWKPPSSLPPSSLSSASTSTAVALSLQAVTGGAPSTFVASNDIHCPVCTQQFGTWDVLTMHYSVFHTSPYLTRPMLHPCAICQEFVADKRQHYMESLRHPKCRTCKEGFEDADALAQHLAARDTCDICIAHLLSSVTMNDHYRMSPIHPTCKLCSMSFRGLDEFEWVLFLFLVPVTRPDLSILKHRKACPPPAAPEPEAVVDTYSPPSVAVPQHVSEHRPRRDCCWLRSRRG
ncbi:hypothetical protein LXA43DRAFT_668259 [Ganoderma leucocontextum]|nr:hypothetical protein LXA43DRAFT_668259 [Ganoderma leucocontextum]